MKSNSLFINTATKSLQFAVLSSSSFKSIDLGSSKKALENSFVGIEKLLSDENIKFSDIDSFYTLLGPGSNTGIRLGLTIVRTVYGLNSKISMHGINTLKVLLTDKKGISLLSDRASNLFVGYYKNEEFVTEKVLKDDVNSNKLFKDKTLYIDKADESSIEIFKEYSNKVLIDVIKNMVDKKDEFENYSKRIDEYLPIYQFDI